MRNLWTIWHYHFSFDPNGAMVKICNAIKDKEEGMGIIWLNTDVEGLLSEMEDLPAAWVIAQDRDFIKRYLINMKRKT